MERVGSSFFEETSRFPPRSVAFDCALGMRDVPHEWHARPALRASDVAALAG